MGRWAVLGEWVGLIQAHFTKKKAGVCKRRFAFPRSRSISPYITFVLLVCIAIATLQKWNMTRWNAHDTTAEGCCSTKAGKLRIDARSSLSLWPFAPIRVVITCWKFFSIMELRALAHYMKNPKLWRQQIVGPLRRRGWVGHVPRQRAWFDRGIYLIRNVCIGMGWDPFACLCVLLN